MRSYDTFVAMWACPHCGAPQAEAARCWVCHRSSTTCSTCRHFRTSLAADVGYCGKDRWRTPLTGLEQRACWEEGRRIGVESGGPEAGSDAGTERRERRPGAFVRGDGGPLDRPNPMRLRGFVPLDELLDPSAASVEPPASSPAPASVPHAALAEPVAGWDRRTSLFGEPER